MLSRLRREIVMFWDSYNEGTYDVGRTKAKRERYLEKKLEAKERKFENGNI